VVTLVDFPSGTVFMRGDYNAPAMLLFDAKQLSFEFDEGHLDALLEILYDNALAQVYDLRDLLSPVVVMVPPSCVRVASTLHVRAPCESWLRVTST
jgi:hypothetical protein